MLNKWAAHFKRKDFALSTGELTLNLHADQWSEDLNGRLVEGVLLKCTRHNYSNFWLMLEPRRDVDTLIEALTRQGFATQLKTMNEVPFRTRLGRFEERGEKHSQSITDRKQKAEAYSHHSSLVQVRLPGEGEQTTGWPLLHALSSKGFLSEKTINALDYCIRDFENIGMDRPLDEKSLRDKLGRHYETVEDYHKRRGF